MLLNTLGDAESDNVPLAVTLDVTDSVADAIVDGDTVGEVSNSDPDGAEDCEGDGIGDVDADDDQVAGGITADDALGDNVPVDGAEPLAEVEKATELVTLGEGEYEGVMLTVSLAAKVAEVAGVLDGVTLAGVVQSPARLNVWTVSTVKTKLASTPPPLPRTESVCPTARFSNPPRP